MTIRIWACVFLSIGFLLLSSCEETTDYTPLSCNSAGYFYFDSITRMSLPNSFSPNADSLNDTFGPVGMCFSDFSLKISDKSDSVLFYDTSAGNYWDGKTPDGKIVEGFYMAEIRFTDVNGNKVFHEMEITLHTHHPNKNVAKDCKFGDMINPYFGFIYPTLEFID
jgi:hypothetical protein